jgi:hypothetical protein
MVGTYITATTLEPLPLYIRRQRGKPLENLHDDMLIGVHYLKNIADDPGTDFKREFEAPRPTLLLHFIEKGYRQRRHRCM